MKRILLALALAVVSHPAFAVDNVQGNTADGDGAQCSVIWIDANTVRFQWNCSKMYNVGLEDSACYLFNPGGLTTSPFSTANNLLKVERHQTNSTFALQGEIDVDVVPGTYVYVQVTDVWNQAQGGPRSTNRFYSKYTGAPKKLVLKLRNDSDVPVDYMVLDANGNQVGGTISLQPHTALIQTFVVPDGTAEPLTAVYRVHDYVIDGNGQWIEVPGGVTQIQATKGGKAVDGSTPAASLTVQDDSGTITDDLDSPLVIPGGSGLESRTGGSIWKQNQDDTTPTDVLTKPVYREGVDKITTRLDAIKRELSDGSVSEKQFDSTAPTVGYEVSADATAVTGILAKLPAAPTITSPGKQSSFSVDFQIPKLTAVQHITIDLSKYDGPILLFRTLVLAGLSIAFFFLSVRAIKEAFA